MGRAEKYNYTTLTLTRATGEEFRELRDERNLTTTGLIKRLMDQYEG